MLRFYQFVRKGVLFGPRPRPCPSLHFLSRVRLQNNVCCASNQVDGGVQRTKIDDNLQLQKSSSSKPGAPLVLLYSWLAAKQRHLDRFANLYLSKGCDVVSITVKPMQLLRPVKGTHKIADKLVDLVQDSSHKDQPLLVHTFSVGAYLHSETLTKILHHDTTHGTSIMNRIAGQVFDSPVDLEQIPYGTSRAMFKNSFAQKSVENLLNLFLNVTHKHTVHHYDKASKIFYSNPASSPLLFMYSKVDPVAPASTIERAMSKLKEEHGKEVYSRNFEDSSHVTHMYQYQKEYVSTLEHFLQQLSCFNKQAH